MIAKETASDRPRAGPGNAALVEKGGIAFTYALGQGDGLVEFFERAAPTTHEVSDAARPQQSLLSGAESPREADASDAVRTVADEDVPCGEPLLTEPEKPAMAPDDMTAPSMDTGSNVVPASVVTPVSAVPASLDMYADFLVKLALALIAGPLSEEDVAQRLGLEKGQAKAWLKKAVELGQVEKLKKPVRYAQCLQASLLG